MEVFRCNPVGSTLSLHQRIGGIILNVEKQYSRSLLNEGLDNGLADSTGASSDKNNLPIEAAVHSGGRRLFHLRRLFYDAFQRGTGRGVKFLRHAAREIRLTPCDD